ncbi:MAG: hypothetical protein CL424_05480 [Acidimicrobiaceae bacterium]|nr:hypothetical protein [Acidimicrobiaceae bacterium]
MDLDEFLAAEAAVAECEWARSRATVLHGELSAEQETCQLLRRRLDETRRRSKLSSTSFIARLLGRRPDPSAPPTPEVAALTSELAAHERAMQRLSTEFASARETAAGLDAARDRLDAATAARAASIAEGGGDRSRRLASIDDELAVTRRVRDDLRAVVSSALRATGALETAIERFGTASGWSVVDVVSDRSGGFRHGSLRFGGDVAGTAKHDALDATVVPVAEAHAALLSLRSELADLGGSGGSGNPDDVHRPNIRMPSSALGTWDVWFDNTFSDLMVHDRIASSSAELRRAAASVDELITELTPAADAAAAQTTALESQRADLLRR